MSIFFASLSSGGGGGGASGPPAPPVIADYTAFNDALIVCKGNSLTLGGWPAFVDDMLTDAGVTGHTVTNLGIGGETTTHMLTTYSSEVAPLFDSRRPCFLLFCEFLNDMQNGVPYPTGKQNVIDYCDLGRATGYKVISQTNIACVNKQVYLTSMNVYQKAHYTEYSDGLVILDEDEDFLDPTVPPYLGDGIHLETAGYLRWAELVFAQIGLMRFA
jgi:lysophospholipase L1-like esterase